MSLAHVPCTPCKYAHGVLCVKYRQLGCNSSQVFVTDGRPFGSAFWSIQRPIDNAGMEFDARNGVNSIRSDRPVEQSADVRARCPNASDNITLPSRHTQTARLAESYSARARPHWIHLLDVLQTASLKPYYLSSTATWQLKYAVYYYGICHFFIIIARVRVRVVYMPSSTHFRALVVGRGTHWICQSVRDASQKKKKNAVWYPNKSGDVMGIARSENVQTNWLRNIALLTLRHREIQ